MSAAPRLGNAGHQAQNMLSVSIIVPCFNARKWIGDALRSAFQPAHHPVEVIVVDDGSTDGSGDVVRDGFPDARLVVTPNRGASHARNHAIARARGQHFLFLDADDLLLPGTVDRLVGQLEQTQADVVYGNWQWLLRDPIGDFRPGAVVRRVMRQSPDLELLGRFWCPTAAYLFRRGIVERVVGFHPGLPVIQDARFVLDCAMLGGTFVHEPETACLHRAHTAGSLSTRSAVALYRDCLKNAIEVRDMWRQGGVLTAERLAAVLEVLDNVAGATVEIDQATFRQACREVDGHRLALLPPGTRLVRLLYRLLGYQRTRSLLHRIQPLFPRAAIPTAFR